MNRNRIALLAALVTSLFTSSASASTLNLIQPNTSRGSYLTFNYNGVDETAFAGALSFSIDGSATLTDMFCVDITTFSYLNSPYEATALPPTILNNGDRAAWLFLNFDSSANTVVTGTALQLALWDVVHDGGNGLSTGIFKGTASISSEIINQAESYITASLGQSASAAVVYESVLGKNDRQLQIGHVPEPSSILLLASGLAFVGWKAKRRKVCA